MPKTNYFVNLWRSINNVGVEETQNVGEEGMFVVIVPDGGWGEKEKLKDGYDCVYTSLKRGRYFGGKLVAQLLRLETGEPNV